MVLLCIGLAMSACQPVGHTTFKGIQQGYNPNGSTYTIWSAPNYTGQDSARVRVWLMDAERFKNAKHTSLTVTHKDSTTAHNITSEGYYSFKLAPGKYSLEASFGYPIPGKAAIKALKVKKGTLYRVVIFYLEDWGKGSLHNVQEYKRIDSIKQQIINGAKKKGIECSQPQRHHIYL